MRPGGCPPAQLLAAAACLFVGSSHGAVDYQCLLQVDAVLGQPQFRPDRWQQVPPPETTAPPQLRRTWSMVNDSSILEQLLPTTPPPPPKVPYAGKITAPEHQHQAQAPALGLEALTAKVHDFTAQMLEMQAGMQQREVRVVAAEQKLADALKEQHRLEAERSAEAKKAHELAEALDKEKAKVFELQAVSNELEHRATAAEKKLAAALEQQQRLEGEKSAKAKKGWELAAAFRKEKEELAAALGRQKNETDACQKMAAAKAEGLRSELGMCQKQLASSERELSAALGEKGHMEVQSVRMEAALSRQKECEAQLSVKAQEMAVALDEQKRQGAEASRAQLEARENGAQKMRMERELAQLRQGLTGHEKDVGDALGRQKECLAQLSRKGQELAVALEEQRRQGAEASRLQQLVNGADKQKLGMENDLALLRQGLTDRGKELGLLKAALDSQSARAAACQSQLDAGAQERAAVSQLRNTAEGAAAEAKDLKVALGQFAMNSNQCKAQLDRCGAAVQKLETEAGAHKAMADAYRKQLARWLVPAESLPMTLDEGLQLAEGLKKKAGEELRQTGGASD